MAAPDVVPEGSPVLSCDVCGRLAVPGQTLTVHTRTRRRFVVVPEGVETRAACEACRSGFTRGGWRVVQRRVAPAASYAYVMNVPGAFFTWLRYVSRDTDWQRSMSWLLERGSDADTLLQIAAGRAAPRSHAETSLWASAVVEGVTLEVAAFLDRMERRLEQGGSATEFDGVPPLAVVALGGPLRLEQAAKASPVFHPTRCYDTTVVHEEVGGRVFVRTRTVERPGGNQPPRVVGVTDAVPLTLLEGGKPFSAWCRHCERFHRDETLQTRRSASGGGLVTVGHGQRQVGWPNRVAWTCPAGHDLFTAYGEVYLVMESSPIACPEPRIDIDALLRRR